MDIKQGDTARLKQPEIKGTVLKRRIKQGSDELELLLEYADESGPHRRWFDAGALERVEQQPEVQS